MGNSKSQKISPKSLFRQYRVTKKGRTEFRLDLSDDQKAEVEISRKQFKNRETEDWDSIIKRTLFFSVVGLKNKRN